MKIKIRWMLVNSFINAGLIFNIIETLYFDITLGWQWTPHNKDEKICDYIVFILFCISLFFFTSILTTIITRFIALEDESNKER